MSDEQIWQVRLPDGSTYVDIDARPDNPRASWIYARSTADEVAERVGGTVVEVTRKQQGKVLDQEIAAALAGPAKPRSTKARKRPFGRTAKRAIATAILESVTLNYHARAALDTARETSDDAEYKTSLRTLGAGLPPALWIGYDADRDRGMAQEAEPVWIGEDPAGEDPRDWMQISRDELARLLVEDLP